MPVETIECQIVQGQLGRYLSGDLFSADAMAELEAHIGKCPICRDEIDRRKSTLQGLLGPQISLPRDPNEALVQALRAQTAQPETRAVIEALVEDQDSAKVSTKTSPFGFSKEKFGKPLIYGTGLAVVLIAMSYVGKNPTSVFGDRAADKFVATTPAIQAPATAPDGETRSKEVESSVPTEVVLNEPITEAEWETTGMGEWFDYDIDSAAALSPVEWLALADALASTETTSEEVASEDAVEEGLEVPPAHAEPVKPPTPIVTEAPKPAVVKASANPALSGPIRKGSTARPKSRARKPRNSIRVYDPTN